jgi:glycosyltransferase involved in cell wall biosynthesis
VRIVGIFDKLAGPLASRDHLLGGAERTALSHLRGLVGLGHHCHVVTPARVRRRGRIRGLPVVTYPDLEELKAILVRLQPEAVVSNLDLVYDAANLAASMGTPHFALLDSFECCAPDETEKALWRVSPTRTHLAEDKVAFALRSSAGVLACSSYLARRTTKRHRVRVETLHPPFDPEEMRLAPSASARGRFISGICGHEYKGASVFLELCRRLPDERFLLAGRVSPELRARLAEHENLTLAPSLTTLELLAQSRIVLVPSQWEEPFGRIAVESMANGIPVLASRTGGLKEIVGHTALGVRAFRDVDAWADGLRTLVRSAAARAANAAAGGRRAGRFLSGDSATVLDRFIRAAARHRRTPARRPAAPTVAIVGGESRKTAFALINRQLGAGLERAGGYRVVHCADAEETGVGAVDCFVHHDYAADFSSLAPPAQGRWVVIRTWDFGAYPATWAAKIRAECDRLWVLSRWNKKLAVRSGIPADRVAVIPCGIDENVFTPRGTRYPVPTRKRFIFLFVGAPVYRKGLDILLDAYGAAFTRHDDVCLVVKAHREDVFYRGIEMLERVTQLQARADYPEIVLLDDFLTASQLASLYRACDVGVFPYRAEGFALPILEAMACGLPSIVPEFGACLDYCSRRSSFRVPVMRVHLPVRGSFQFNTLGFREEIDEVDFCEVPVPRLAQEMRRVTRLPNAVMRRKAAEGVRISHGRFTWTHTAARIRRELEALFRRRVPVRLAAARRLRATEQRWRTTAEELFAKYSFSKVR